MCSVTFIPRENGYALAMNRDEQRSRAPGLPPSIDAARHAVYPSESDGGTWIGVNQSGVAFTLLNWYSVPWKRPAAGVSSRGEIIPRLLGQVVSLGALHSACQEIPCHAYPPFRLVAYLLEQKVLQEWQWDGTSLRCIPFSWQARHWFSSGFDEPLVQAERARTARAAWQMADAGSPAWVTRLHASHNPKRGPTSICMHRQDACTVSSTELQVEWDTARMTYRPGAPCECTPAQETTCVLRIRTRHTRCGDAETGASPGGSLCHAA